MSYCFSYWSERTYAAAALVANIHRCNASRKSHEELDSAPELDSGDPEEFGRLSVELKKSVLPWLHLLGGCCGTSQRHIEQICIAWEKSKA